MPSLRSLLVPVLASASVSIACGTPVDGYTQPLPEPPVTPSSDAAGAEAQPTTPTDDGAPDDAATPDVPDVPDVRDAAADAGPGCDLPARDCEGSASYCGALVAFDPRKGVGYDDYPINGETSSNQYRSWARRDLMMLVRWAAAYVDCKANGWSPGNGAPIGLGDMSEKSGAIPGTSIGSPGHPSGSHLNGHDMDIAYFQTSGEDNRLRVVCPHTSGGKDVYHCTGTPTILDVKRTALFLGAFLTSPRVRVIGVDGKIGPLVSPVLLDLCDEGVLPQSACDAKSKLAWETSDTGRGWYKFHHHHLHVSLKKVSADEVEAEEVDREHDLDLVPAGGD